MTDPSDPQSPARLAKATASAASGALSAASSQGDSAAKSEAGSDRLVVCGRSESGYHVLRKRNQQLELGQVQPLRDGHAINGEVVRLTPHAQTGAYDVEVLMEAPNKGSAQTPGANAAPPAQLAAQPGHKGPARVTSETYRRGWDAIFGVDSEDDEHPSARQSRAPIDYSKLN